VQDPARALPCLLPQLVLPQFSLPAVLTAAAEQRLQLKLMLLQPWLVQAARTVDIVAGCPKATATPLCFSCTCQGG
jgi:hypothetical protein